MSTTTVAEAATGGRDGRAPTTQRLVVAWQHPESGAIEPIGVLSFDGRRYRYGYVAHVLQIEGFRPLVGFPGLHDAYESAHLFPIFAQRAMDPRRADFTRYVTSLGLGPAETTPWEQIARSGGRREGDRLQLFPVPVETDGLIECTFLIHGTRHMTRRATMIEGRERHVSQQEYDDALAGLVEGSSLSLIAEPENPKNPQALLVATATGVPIGYVPNLLVRDLRELTTRGRLRTSIVRVNGPEAPAHLRVVAKVVAEGDSGFEFFTDERWRSLAQAR